VATEHGVASRRSSSLSLSEVAQDLQEPRISHLADRFRRFRRISHGVSGGGRRLDGAARINPRQDNDTGGAGAGAATLLRFSAAVAAAVVAATDGRERVLSTRRCRGHHGGCAAPSSLSGVPVRSAIRRRCPAADHPATLCRPICRRSDSPR
jgi:hypothetical protein